MNEDINSFAAPISEDNPAGSDLKGDDDFMNIKDEIDKSVDIPDWYLISSLSETILKEKSKHLYVAAYMGEAEIQLNQFNGFISGLELMCILLENFGNAIYPKIKPAQNSALKYWIKRSESLLNLHKPSKISETLMLQLENEIDRLKKLMKDYLERPNPSLNQIVKILKTIPVEKIKKEKIEKKKTEKTDNKHTNHDVTSSKKQSPEINPTEDKKTDNTQNNNSESLKLDNPKNIKQSISSVLQNCEIISRAIRNLDLEDTNSYFFNRLYSWGKITGLPPINSEGNTNIEPPDKKLINHLTQLEQDKNWSELLKRSENCLPDNKFYLDLNCYSAIAANQLGDEYKSVATKIEQETGFFLIRFPGIEKLTFNDGTPFVSSKAQKWLEQVSISSGTSENIQLEAEDANFTKILQDIHTNESYKEMIPLIQTQIKEAISYKNKHYWRSELVNLLLKNSQYEYMVPHLEIMLEEINRFNMEQWDQDYALKVYMWAIECYQLLSTEQAKSRVSDLQQKIIKLDLINAMKMFAGSK